MLSATLSLARHTLAARQLPRLKSRELFRDSNELIIEHQGQEYRLRWTRNDKLILNK
ncbi:MAG: hemin uptake protein HemP [Panacagrimonas sp.]